MFRTARQRLAAWNVVVLTLILAILGISFYVFYSQSIYKEVDQQLQDQQSRVDDALQSVGNDVYSLYSLHKNPFLPQYRAVIADANGQVNSTSDCPYWLILRTMQQCPTYAQQATSDTAIDQVLKTGQQDIRTVTFLDEPQRVLTFPVTLDGQIQGVVQISRSVAAEQADLDQLRRLLLLGTLFAITLSAVGSFFLASKALVPIRQAFARQRQFTADASHELRTPLALIRANAEMLCRHSDGLPEGDGELIGEIIQETDHLNRLVSDLLTLARADSDQLKLATKRVDFRALVSDVHEDVHRVAESRGVDSEVSLDGPIAVEGDETRLRQLLLILLDNALKYTDPGGRVDIALHRDGERARLVVADTGIGIPAEDLPHIFDRFYRVDRAREHESGGTGLGLAIAHWIVQAHHGSIKVDSNVGKGTRFQIDLPAASS